METEFTPEGDEWTILGAKITDEAKLRVAPSDWTVSLLCAAPR